MCKMCFPRKKKKHKKKIFYIVCVCFFFFYSFFLGGSNIPSHFYSSANCPLAHVSPPGDGKVHMQCWFFSCCDTSHWLAGLAEAFSHQQLERNGL